MNKKLHFDLEGIFNLGNEDFNYNEKRKELSIFSQDYDLLKVLAKKSGGRIYECHNFGKVVIRGKKAVEFVENYSY